MKIQVLNLHALTGILKKIFALFTVLSLVLVGAIAGRRHPSFAFVQVSSETDLPLVILDAGHGGEDSGAVGADGTLEKDVNLALTYMLGEMLRENGYAVIFTRTEDALLYTAEENIKGMRKIYDLKNRVAIAERYPDAIFVSIHMNAFGQEQYRGLQVYYNVSGGTSEQLARAVQDEVILQVQEDNRRKIKRGEGMYLLENMQNTSILIECGFLSNPEECKKLCEKEYQKQLCFAIVCGMIKYESMKKQS